MEDGQRSERSLAASGDGRANSIQPKLNATFGLWTQCFLNAFQENH